MFLSRVPSIVALRLPRLSNCLKQGRFISVNGVIHARKSETASSPDIEKQTKSSKSKKTLEDEQSRLYPDEWGKMNYNISEEFSFMNDNYEQLSNKHPTHKLPETEIMGQDRIYEKEIASQNTDREETCKIEIESDSDSDSDGGMDHEICEGSHRRNKSLLHRRSKIKYFVNVLPKRSEFLKSKMEDTRSNKSNYVKIEGLSEIYNFASLGSKPDIIFAADSNVLSSYPTSLDEINLYEVPKEDLIYWSNKRCNAIALYDKKNLKNYQWGQERKLIPLSVVCHGIRSNFSMGPILNTSAACSAKVILSSLESKSFWDPDVVRTSEMGGLYIENESFLTWHEISKRISTSERVLVLNESFNWQRKPFNRYPWSEFPSIDLYDDLWGDKNVTLLVNGTPEFTDQNVLRFCRERDARLVTLDTYKQLTFCLAFHVVAFELRRQWLVKSDQIGNKKEEAAKETRQQQQQQQQQQQDEMLRETITIL